MREGRGVLRALLVKEHWDRYGELLASMFTGTNSAPVHRKLYQIIKDHWASTVNDSLTEDLLSAYVEQAAQSDNELVDLQRELSSLIALELGDDLEKLLSAAVNNHSLSQLLIDAHRELTQTGRVEVGQLVDKLEDIERSALNKDSLELFSPDMVEDLLADEEDCAKFPTGFPSLDKMLSGGLWESELGVMLGEVHIGKTWGLTYLGAQSLLSGTPVIHFTGEITKRRTHIRYYQSLCELERFYVLTHPKEVRDHLADLLLPRWSVVDFSNRTFSTHQLRQDVLRFCDGLDTPPLIIVDYIDKLKSGNKTLQERHALNDITEHLRRIACEVNGGLWTASQVGRSAYGETYVRKENVAEAIGKVEIADVIITLNQEKAEKQFGQMRWLVEKARERTLPAIPSVALRCKPEVQSFEEDRKATEEQFAKWKDN